MPKDMHWVGTWATAPAPAEGAAFSNQTLRMNARISIGGDTLRVRLSNAYGTRPLTIGAAHIGLRATGAGIVPDSDRALTFGGEASATIAAGALLLSDPVELSVRAAGGHRDHLLAAGRPAGELRHHRTLCAPDQLHLAPGRLFRPRQ